MIAATVLAAVRATGGPPAKPDLGQMGDLSLLLDRALDQIDSLAGVSRLVVEVESDRNSASVTVVGEGDDIERPSAANPTTFVDPLTRSAFDWSPTSVRCSFQVQVGPAAVS